MAGFVDIFRMAMGWWSEEFVPGSYSFTGPSIGRVGNASANFVVTPDQDSTGVIVTPHSSGAGDFNPPTVTFSGSDPATFTYTPSAPEGSPHVISVTNDGGLNDPGSKQYTILRSPRELIVTSVHSTKIVRSLNFN